MLAERDEYLSRGVHIGMRTKSKDMGDFVFHVKKSKLAVIDVEKTDQRLEIAAKFLANYEPEEIVAVSRKENGIKPILKMQESCGIKALPGRFLPGMFTNPNSKEYTEPKIIIITDPSEDKQAVKEALAAKLPIIAICDTGNFTDNIDFIIPANNKGKKSLGLMYYLLTKNYMINKGLIKKETDFNYSIEDFTTE